MQSVQVRDYMTKHPVVLSAQMSLDNAAEILIQAGQTGAPVVDSEQRVVGFVSEQELLKIMLKNTYHCELHEHVGDIMRTDVVTVDASESVLELAQRMLDNKPKIYPVVENGALIGMINRSRVLQALNSHLKQCFKNSA